MKKHIRYKKAKPKNTVVIRMTDYNITEDYEEWFIDLTKERTTLVRMWLSV